MIRLYGDPDTWFSGTRFENRRQRIKQDTCPSGIQKALDLTSKDKRSKAFTVFVFLTTSSQPLKSPEIGWPFLTSPQPQHARHCKVKPQQKTVVFPIPNSHAAEQSGGFQN